MPTLQLIGTDITVNLAEGGRSHWLIGRGSDCDLIVHDIGISRYHATVFRHRDRFHVIDHSLNGTHLCAGDATLSERTRVPNMSTRRTSDQAGKHDTQEIEIAILAAKPQSAPQESEDELNKSRVAFRQEQLATRLPRMVGYIAHSLHDVRDMQSLLEMIYSVEGADALSSMGRTLHPDVRLYLIGTERHSVRFTA